MTREVLVAKKKMKLDNTYYQVRCTHKVLYIRMELPRYCEESTEDAG